MHRFGQDLLLSGILAMAWLLGERQLGVRIDDFEHVSGWRGSVAVFTGFLLVMVAIALGATDRLRWRWLATAGSLTYPLYLLHYVAGMTDRHQPPAGHDGRAPAGGRRHRRLPAAEPAVHRFVERPPARVLKRGLEGAFGRMRRAEA
ncbi:hypothetical protein [Streptomyces sp. MAI_2237]